MKSMPPETAQPIDPREFAQAVLLGIAAGESPGGGDYTVDRPNANGSVDITEIPDNPYSKATFALRRHYRDDDHAFASALMRFRALMSLLGRGALQQWVHCHPRGRIAIHPAALDVASQMRLSKNGRFAPRKFLNAVAETAHRHYPQFSWAIQTDEVAN